MHVWIVVLALLALAVVFLFISLFLKDNQYDDELDELSESLLELHREVYSMKKKIQEMEGTPIYRAPVEHTSEPATEPAYQYAPPAAPVEDEPAYTRYEPTYEPEPTPAPTYEPEPAMSEDDLHSITRKHILTLFSHGSSYEEISEQLNVPVSTVELVIDSYFDAAKR